MTDRTLFHRWRRVLLCALGAAALCAAPWVLLGTRERPRPDGAPVGEEEAGVLAPLQQPEALRTPAMQPAEVIPERPATSGRGALPLYRPGPADRERAAPLVRFVAVDELDTPLRDIRITVGDLGRGVEIVTDSDGRAELRAGDASLDEALELVARRPRNRDWLIADLRVSLAPRADERARDLGEVVFEGPPPSARELLAAGHVLDELGAPVADASLLVTPEAGQRAWRASARTGADGSFRILGPAADGLRIQVRADGRTTLEQADIEAGATGLVFRLARTARLDVEILLDAEIPADLLGLHLEGPAVGWKSVQPRVLVDDLPPGEYDLEVCTVSGHWPVARVEDLVVRAEELSPDPRVHPLDLRGTLVPCHLVLQSSDGSAIAGKAVTVHVVEWGTTRVRTDEGGRIFLLVPARAGEIELRPPGHAPQRCSPSAGERMLVFRRE